MIHDYSTKDAINSENTLKYLSGFPKLLTLVDENKIQIFAGPLDYKTRTEIFNEAISRENGEIPLICGKTHYHSFTDYRDSGIEKILFYYNTKDAMTKTITYCTKTEKILQKK